MAELPSHRIVRSKMGKLPVGFYDLVQSDDIKDYLRYLWIYLPAQVATKGLFVQ